MHLLPFTIYGYTLCLESYSLIPEARGLRAWRAPLTDEAAPVLRNRVDKEAWRLVERDNQVLAAKLRAISREPPSNFHGGSLRVCVCVCVCVCVLCVCY